MTHKHQAALDMLIQRIEGKGYEVRIRRVKFKEDERGSNVVFTNSDSPSLRTPGFNWKFNRGNEHVYKNNAIYARKSNGFTIVHLIKNNNRLTGRSICSATDKFDGRIGALKALHHALRSNNVSLK